MKKGKQILEDLDETEFKVFAIIVDKRQLVGQGLRYKGSLFKFLHGLTDRELSGIYPDLELVTSQPGPDSFMQGFIGYVHHNPILPPFSMKPPLALRPFKTMPWPKLQTLLPGHSPVVMTIPSLQISGVNSLKY